MILRWLREGKNTTEIARLLDTSIEEAAERISLFAGRRKSSEHPTPNDQGGINFQPTPRVADKA